MKIKKMFALLLAALMLCSLAACKEEKPNENGANLDWVWVRDYPTHGVITENGYYYTDSDILQYADFTVGASTVLCTTAGCSHKEECDAHLQSYGTYKLLYWNERIYYFDILEPVLYSRDATGMNLKKVGSVAGKYVEEGKAAKIGRYAAADGYLFYEVNISDKVVTEEGFNTTRLVMQSIGRIDLSTGKDEIVYEEKIEDPAEEKLILCAARGNGLLLNYWSGLGADPRDPDYQQKLQESKSDLLHWDIEKREMTILFEKNIPECAGVKMVSGGKVYYKTLSGTDAEDAGYTYSYDLNTGKTETACAMQTRWHLGGSYVQCIDPETQKTIIYDMASGQKLPYDLEKTGTVYNAADNGFVVCITGQEELIYYFVSLEALKDGLQQTDLVALFTRKLGYS